QINLTASPPISSSLVLLYSAVNQIYYHCSPSRPHWWTERISLSEAFSWSSADPDLQHPLDRFSSPTPVSRHQPPIPPTGLSSPASHPLALPIRSFPSSVISSLISRHRPCLPSKALLQRPPPILLEVRKCCIGILFPLLPSRYQ
ncbi:hypothetical protein LINPERPRIM_LOCUS38998, partial [Linum perenne]